ncbi:MAG: hypothetical protein ACKVVP_24170 [Chloroflexota bacterium]
MAVSGERRLVDEPARGMGPSAGSSTLEGPVRWPVDWSAAWVGALASIAIALIIGLMALAVGAHRAGPAPGIPSWREFGLGALVFSVAGGFFAFVAGGWIAGKISGWQRAEPAMLHGVIAWLIGVPILLILAALGAGNLMGAWYGGLTGVPMWATPSGPIADPGAAAAARNAALGAVTTLLLGLVGSVLGGWMASGEPMRPAHYRTRDLARAPRAA